MSLARASDAFLDRTIRHGRSGTTMSAWSMSRGGPLPDTEIDAVVALLRSWQVAPAALVDAEAVTGDPARGASLYAAACAKCHGRPEAPEKGPRLWTPELLAAASDGFLRVTIAEGRPGTTMPSFAGQLAEDEIRHVVSYLRSLARPPHELTPIPPRPGQLADVVAGSASPASPCSTRACPCGGSAGIPCVRARSPDVRARGDVPGRLEVR